MVHSEGGFFVENVIAVLQSFSKFSPEQQQQVLALVQQVASTRPVSGGMNAQSYPGYMPGTPFYTQPYVAQPVTPVAKDDDFLEILGGGIAGLGAFGGVLGALTGVFPPAGGALLLLAGCLGGSVFLDSSTSVTYGDLSFQRSR